MKAESKDLEKMNPEELLAEAKSLRSTLTSIAQDEWEQCFPGHKNVWAYVAHELQPQLAKARQECAEARELLNQVAGGCDHHEHIEGRRSKVIAHLQKWGQG